MQASYAILFITSRRQVLCGDEMPSLTSNIDLDSLGVGFAVRSHATSSSWRPSHVLDDTLFIETSEVN